MDALQYALEGLDELIQANEDTATYKGKKIKFKDPSRRKAGKSAWGKFNYKWLRDHPDSPIAPVVRQHLAKQRKLKKKNR